MKRVIFGAALLLAAGCSSSGNTASTAGPLRVSTIVVEPREDLHAGIYVGVVEEENAAALSFPVAGTVTRLCVEEGTRVRQGDLIAELDATSARDAFEAAKAALQTDVQQLLPKDAVQLPGKSLQIILYIKTSHTSTLFLHTIQPKISFFLFYSFRRHPS